MGHKTKTGGGGGGNFEKPAVGLKSPAVLAAYYPVGTHETTWSGKKKMQDKIVLCWELDAKDSKGEQFQMWEMQTDSMFGDSRLKGRVESILGRAITAEEQDEGFDMDGALGKCGMLYVGGDTTKGSVWVEKVDELQVDTKVVVRHKYDRLPRFVKWALGKAEVYTAPGMFGAIIDGEVFYGMLPPEDEEGSNEENSQESGEAPF